MKAKKLPLRKWAWAAVLAGALSGAVAEPMMPVEGLPSVSVQATDPLASEPGNNPGSFTISRAWGTNAALTVPFGLGGTASNGVDYALIPTSVTLAAGQLSTHILITPITEPAATGYKTVVLTLPRAKREREAAQAFFVGSLNRALVYMVYNYTNLPPSVSLISPTNGASFLSQPNLLLAATASDSNGWVTAVQYFANGASLGIVSNCAGGYTPPQTLVMRETRGSILPVLPGARLNRYKFVWTNVAPGNYALTAVATDNAGLQTTSAAVNITVTTNLPVPFVRILNPVNGADFPDLAPIHLYAAAGETNGVVDTVEFFANGVSLGTATNYLAAEPMVVTAPIVVVGPPLPPFPPPLQPPSRVPWLPFYLRWTNAPVGSNILTAVAADNNGSKATSARVIINVTTNLYRPHHPW